MPFLLGTKTERENRGSDSKAEAWRKRTEQGILGDRGKGSGQDTWTRAGHSAPTAGAKLPPRSVMVLGSLLHCTSQVRPALDGGGTHIPYPLTGSVPPTGTGAWSWHCVPLFLFNAVLPILEQGLFMEVFNTVFAE